MPRNQNTEADDLTNARYEEFDASRRVEVDLDRFAVHGSAKAYGAGGQTGLRAEVAPHLEGGEARQTSGGEEPPEGEEGQER